ALRRPTMEYLFDLGPALGLVIAQGSGFQPGRTNMGVDPGIRAAVGLRAWIGRRWALSFLLHGTRSFKPPTLVVNLLNGANPPDSQETVPSWFVGLDLGVAIKIR